MTGAKAQLQIGLIRLEQKRYAEAANELMVGPLTYDYKDLTPVALLEAARSFGELKQVENATALVAAGASRLSANAVGYHRPRQLELYARLANDRFPSRG